MSRKDYLYAGLFLIIAIGFKGWRDGFTSQAAPLPSSTYLPLVRLLPVSKVITPPQGLKCLLQTNTTVVMDPQTQELIYSCEEKHGHGFIVFTKVAWRSSMVWSSPSPSVRMAVSSGR
jgi:hypothetical protein